MGITADRLKQLGFVDTIIEEPMGGAHRDHETTAAALKRQLEADLAALRGQPSEELLDSRYRRLMGFGVF